MANSLFDSPLFQPPFIYIILIGVTIAIFAIIFIKYKGKNKDVHFKGETLEDVLRKQNLDKYFDSFSRKLKRGKLFYNVGEIKVCRMALFRTTFEQIKIRDNTFIKHGKIEDKRNRTELEEKEFIVFKKGSFLMNIPLFNKLVKGDYYIIDNHTRYIHKDATSDNWIVSQDVHFHLFGGIWVLSSAGTAYLTELIYKKIYENSKEVEFNTPKRFVWYNDKYADNYTGQIINADLEKEKWANKQNGEIKR